MHSSIFFIKFLTPIILILSIISCNLINPDEEIPTYFKVSKFEIETNISEQGSNSNSITDVWVNIDGNLLGIYELPAKFPILASGKHEIILRTGIKNNGIAASRIIYPFYTFYTLDTILDENNIMVLNPKSTYKEECIFIWNENFENSGISLKTISNSDTSLQVVSNEVFEGNYSGAIFLDSIHRIFECLAIDSVILSRTNSPIYLEIDLKSDLNNVNKNFEIGLYEINSYNATKGDIYFPNSTNNEWKKIYIDLSQYVISHYTSKYFKFYIRIILDPTINNASIYIDNLKIIHF